MSIFFLVQDTLFKLNIKYLKYSYTIIFLTLLIIWTEWYDKKTPDNVRIRMVSDLYKVFICIYYSGFIQYFLIVLKLDNILNLNWHIIFGPYFIIVFLIVLGIVTFIIMVIKDKEIEFKFY